VEKYFGTRQATGGNIQGGSNITGTNCDLFTHKSSRSYLNHLVIWCVRLACWIPKAANINSEYVILIALSRKQWVCERPSVLRYTYVPCLVSVQRDVLCTNHRN
jgi:hypothetical protein